MTSVRDIIIVAVLLFAIGITTIFSVKIGHDVNSELLKVTAINESAEATAVLNKTSTAMNMSDYIYLAIFLSFFISIVAFGWFIDGSSIMAPIYFFLVIIFTFVSTIFQLVWKDLVLNAELVATMAYLPITNFILSNIAFFIAVFGLVGIILMYAKPQAQGGTF